VKFSRPTHPALRWPRKRWGAGPLDMAELA